MNLLRKEAIFIVSLFIGIGVCSRVVMDFSESDPMDVKNMVKINDIYKDCGNYWNINKLLDSNKSLLK